jgi:hypothetical protein
MEKVVEKGSFKISAEILQKNAAKASIRDLNAEFQQMGGKVIHKTSKKGDNYQLSHQDEAYLEQFRVRLFKELGLIDDKASPEKGKKKGTDHPQVEEAPLPQETPKAPPPRYGDKYPMRRGWNVRSPAEFKQGKFTKEDVLQAEGTPPEREGTDGPVPGPGTDVIRDGPPSGPRGQRLRGPPREDNKGERVSYHKPGPGKTYVERPETPPVRSSNEWRPEPREDTDFEDENDTIGAKSFDDRWGDTTDYLEIIEEALNAGAVDDGDIIRFAYQKKAPEDRIKRLKKLLWDSRCTGARTNCPHNKKKFRFEELMKVCSGEVEGWDNIDSPFIRFLGQWEKNVEKMYGPFQNRTIDVEGKISSFKPVYRKGHEHLKLLIYDTLVKDVEKGGASKVTRKFWVRIDFTDWNRFTGSNKVHVEDIVKLRGKCILDSYFHDHWIVEVTSLEVLKEGDGEVISAPMV